MAMPRKLDAIIVRANVWDRLPQETNAAWEAFQLYRDMGPGRTVPQVVEELGISRSNGRNWAHKHEWTLRTACYDAYLDGFRQREAVKLTVQDMNRRHQQVAQRMIDTASTRIEQFATRPELMDTMTARDAVAMAKEGAAIERVAMGEKTDDKGGDIIFNFNMALPSWAPGNVKIVDATIKENASDAPAGDSA